MGIWGRVAICNTSIPDHDLGIQTHTTFFRKEIKEVIRGQRKIREEEK
jgi:hypothetical protein